MVTIPAFQSSGRKPTSRYFPLLAAVLGLLLTSGCALQPTPPLSLDNDSQPVPASARTFDTRVQPAPGRTGFLEDAEAEVIRQMQALNYTHVPEEGDLTIGIRLSRTDSVIPFMDTVESGRLTLILYQGDTILRTGRSPNLNSIDLDFMSDDDMAERVRLFLDGIQTVSKSDGISN